MIQVVLDAGGYYTGQFSTVGNLENSVEVENLPDIYSDILKQKSYKFEDGSWAFDEQKYNSLVNAESEEALNQIKAAKISESKKELERFMKETTITSNCHKGVEGQYSITSEKQQHLANMILTATMAVQAGIPYQPSWNESGKSCTYDWTVEELQQLAFEIESVVRPLVSSQQKLESKIKECKSEEEVNSIEISYSIK